MSALLQVLSEKKSKNQPCVMLVGLPNSGKTSLFNRLTGLRGHTANFPGTTVEVREGDLQIRGQSVHLYDLPGLYALDGSSLDQVTAKKAICGEAEGIAKPDLLIMVLDATRLPHQLPLVAEVREQGVPTLIALNMIDDAKRRGIEINIELLKDELGAEVVPVSARVGTGIDVLLKEVDQIITGELALLDVPAEIANCARCTSCSATARCKWADKVAERVSITDHSTSTRNSDFIDQYLTSPLLGLPVFALAMGALFVSVFSIATVPMDWIDSLLGLLTAKVNQFLPDGLLSSFVCDGVIAGIGGVIVFLPQICILFFGITLLEDSGYLARAVVVMDSVMRRFGLPGQAFVPMLAAHACAIPAILSTRLIENQKDRLRTILILPLLTCSARLPVYLMVAVLLFGNDPLGGSLIFTSCYLLGALAAVCVSFLLSRTIVPGAPENMAIELPPYRIPNFVDACKISFDRGLMFLRQAGTVILSISIVLWFLSAFPRLPENYEVSQKHSVEASVENSLVHQELRSRAALEYSFAGRIGKFIEPVFAPLGFDWRLSIGVLSSFAAREVVVSALAVMSGVGGEVSEDDPSLIKSLRNMKRPDGSSLFDIPTALSLLVFFVLAMQCLPTQVITMRETGSWKWPLFQISYMTVLAYGSAWITYTVSSILIS